MATSKRKTAAGSARKRSSSPKRSTANIQDSFFKRNKLALIIFILLFGAIGAYLIVTSHAQSYVELHIGSQNGNCVGSNTIQNCDWSNDNRVWVDNSGNSEFNIKSKANMCLDDWNGQVQTKPQSQGGVRAYVHYVSCNQNLDQQWYWNGANNHELRNKASGGCLNALGDSTAPGTPLGVYSCNGSSNEAFYESQQPSTGGSGGGTTSVGQQFVNRAWNWQGEPYEETGSAGSHSFGAYATYKSRCENATNHPIISGYNPDCAMDCSGFVSVILDDVLGTNYGWIVDSNGYMSGTGSANWKQLASVSNAQAGDIVTAGGHVEFVRSVSGSTVYTIGEHHSGTTAGPSTGTGYYTKAFRWNP